MKKTFGKIFSMPLTVLALLLFFIAIGGATFVENDFGTPVAQKWIYKSSWFALILFYLSISLIFNMIKYKLFRLKKISSLLFHLAFLVIVIGAVVTRYTGFEGVMTIREGESSNQIISLETFLQIKAHDNVDQYTLDLPVVIDTNEIAYVATGIKGGNPLTWLGNVFFDHNNYFEHEFDFKGSHVKLSCLDVFRNPKDTIIPTAGGEAYLELVTGGMETNYLKTGEVKLFDSGLKVSFNNSIYADAINIIETDSGLYVQSPFDISYLQMSDQSQGVLTRDSLQEFIPKRLYVIDKDQFVFRQYYLGAELQTIESDENLRGLLGVALKVEEDKDGQHYEKEVVIKGGKGLVPNMSYFNLESGLNFELGFGSKIIEVPFFIHLRDFQLDKYPGTMNPSSFASEVTLIDLEKGVEDERRIFMNNVLDYGGYRFFQSSYDPDEGGTVLSVNHDWAGTWLTYWGYIFLGLGFLLNLVGSKTRFRMLIKKSLEVINKSKKLATILFLIFFNVNMLSAQELPVVDKDHADKFGRLIVQDQGGRFKPVHTLAHEMLRKVSRESKWKEQTPVQVFVGLHTHPGWFQEPMIYVSGKPLREKFHIEGKYAALADFLFIDPTQIVYLLNEDAEEARRKKPSERSQYDKDVLKTDERINVMFGVFNMSYLRIFPKPDDSTHTWYAPYELKGQFKEDDSTFVSAVMKMYVGGVNNGYETGSWTSADQALTLIHTYQQRTADPSILPSESTLEWEIWYNDANIFKKLMSYYIGFGLLLLILAFVQIFAPKLNLKWPSRVGILIFSVLFLFHAFGLGLRWYLSGHAPWSNGYEAVVFVASVVVLIGLVLSRFTIIILGAAGILAWLLLFVAHMNQMDPEMTNLVPVLQSYWLMIHVAVITGSYAFLGIGAMLSAIILLMNLFMTKNNFKEVSNITKLLTHISEITITIGLFMLTIGTFLGGVWANESWGRYWGWDAKETWALASVVIYIILLHIRFIPGMKSQFAFNFWSLWSYGAIIMTFFGVNYYLTGLHSYAKGDPVPIPNWVPITVTILFLFCMVSLVKWYVIKKWKTAPKVSSDTEIV